MTEARHDSVMLSEVLGALALKQDDTVVDATIGGAGHFAAILSALGDGGMLIGIDADPAAAERGREVYAADRRANRPVAHIVNDNFRNIAHILERLQIGRVDAILFDLGWSGYQIVAQRGFSFQSDEPLLMTYGDDHLPQQGVTAADIVNTYSEADLADILHTYGEERFSRSIAKAIVKKRGESRIMTTNQLVSAIYEGTPSWYHKRKIHPATKTFQALRIAVNDEIGSIRQGFADAISALSAGGRLVVITFHSIEDRIVKNIFRDAVFNHYGIILPKKPLTPTRSEILQNRRARSAKLRIFIKHAPSATVEAAGDALQTFTYA